MGGLPPGPSARRPHPGSVVSAPSHLVRRFAGSLRRTPLSGDEAAFANGQLTPGEWALFASMPLVDQRHAVEVARRFVARRPTATTAEVAGALLHDVGKTGADLGTFGRVVATLVGPRTERFRAYHDHERIGAARAARAGSDPVTVELIAGTGDGPAATALQAADDSI